MAFTCSKPSMEILEQYVQGYASYEIFPKLTLETPERCYLRFDFFIVNFESISNIVLVFPLGTLNK